MPVSLTKFQMSVKLNQRPVDWQASVLTTTPHTTATPLITCSEYFLQWAGTIRSSSVLVHQPWFKQSALRYCQSELRIFTFSPLPQMNKIKMKTLNVKQQQHSWYLKTEVIKWSTYERRQNHKLTTNKPGYWFHLYSWNMSHKCPHGMTSWRSKSGPSHF